LSVVSPIKKLYYFFEDGYYNLLDKVNKLVPIYRVIDPIDRVIPSFLLSIIVLAAIIAGAVFVAPLLPSLFDTGFSTKILVVDDIDNALANVEVQLTIDGNKQGFLTDSNGLVALKLAKKPGVVSALVEVSGFETFDKGVLLEKDSVAKIKLKKIVIVAFSGPFNISVIDASSGDRLTDTEVTVSFSCSGDALPPQQMTKDTGFFTVSAPEGCNELRATFSAAGYEQKNGVLVSQENQTVSMSKLPEPLGTINVLVKDENGDAAPNAVVAIFDAAGTKLVDDVTDASGRRSFEDIEPGDYNVTATAEYGSQATKSVSVSANDTVTVELELPPKPSPQKMIFLKLIDSNSSEAINDALVELYVGTVFNPNTSRSNSAGLVSINVAPQDTVTRFTAVVKHPSYVLKILDGLVVVDDSVRDPQVIELDKLAPDHSNYGSAKVFVMDEDSNAIAAASVSLFLQAYPNPLFAQVKTADNNGFVLFENLPAGTYKAYAKKGSFEEDFSPAVQLNPIVADNNRTIVLIALLVLGRGGFKAKVTDSTGVAVSGAAIEIKNILDGNVLDSGTTNALGIFVSRPLKAKKNVSLRASATGFLQQTSSLFYVVKDYNRDVNFLLYRASDIDPSKDISFNFLGLFNANGAPIGIIAAGQTYYAKFHLILPTDSIYSDITMHLRAGLDSQLAAAASSALVQNIFAPLQPESPIFSREFNPANAFSDQNTVASDSNAKQVNVSWRRLEKGSLEITAKISTKPGLADGTPIELHYLAKAKVNESIFTTADFFRRFKIGEPVCTQNCPNSFEWALELRRDANRTVIIPNSDRIELKRDYDYNIFYRIFNLGDSSFAASLEAKTDAATIFSFTNSSIASISLPAHSYFTGIVPISFKTISEADFADMNLLLTTTPASQNYSSNPILLPFRVVSGTSLLLDTNPKTLPKNPIGLRLEIIIKDAATGALLNDSAGNYCNAVKVAVDSEAVSAGTARMPAKTTDKNGSCYIDFEPGFLPQDFAFIRVRLPNYAIATKKVFVTGEYIDFVSNFNYGCIRVDADALSAGDQNVVQLERGNSVELVLKSVNCQYPSTVSLSVPSYLASDVTFTYPGGVPAVSLAKTQSDVRVRVNTQSTVPLGKIPIYVNAKFSADDFSRRLRGVALVVLTPENCVPGASFSTVVVPPQCQTVPSSCFVQGNDLVCQFDSTQADITSFHDYLLWGASLLPVDKFESGCDLVGNGWGGDYYWGYYKIKNLDGLPQNPSRVLFSAYAESGASNPVTFCNVNAPWDLTNRPVSPRGADCATSPYANAREWMTIDITNYYKNYWKLGNNNGLELSAAGTCNTHFVWSPPSNANASLRPKIIFEGACNATTVSVPVSGDSCDVASGNCFSMNKSTPLSGVSVINETSRDDFAQGLVDKLDLDTVPGDLMLQIEEGSKIVEIFPSWFAVPATDKVYVFYRNTLNTKKAFNTPGVTPKSNIVAKNGYFGVVSNDIVWSGFYNDSAVNPPKLISKNTPGTKPYSSIVFVNKDPKGLFAVTASTSGEGRVYVWDATPEAGKRDFSIIPLSGINETSSLVAEGDYIGVVGDDNSYVWNYNNITNESANPIRSFFTLGTKPTSKLVATTLGKTYFSTVANEGKAYTMVADYSAPSFVIHTMPGITAASNIVPTTDPAGFFYAVGENRVYSWYTFYGSDNATYWRAFDADGLMPESNLAVARLTFVAVGKDKTYSGIQVYAPADSAGYAFRTFDTPGTMPNSSLALMPFTEYYYNQHYFAVLAPNKIYSAYTYYPQGYLNNLKTYSFENANIHDLPLNSSITVSHNYFFAAGNNVSYVWQKSDVPRSFDTLGTKSYSTVQSNRVDGAATTAFAVNAKGKAFIVPITAGAAAKEFALPGVSYRSSIAGFATLSSFFTVGIDHVYFTAYASPIADFETQGVTIPRYYSSGTYTTKNYASFSQGPQVLVEKVSWKENKPAGTSINAEASFDNGTSWIPILNRNYVSRTASQVKLKFNIFSDPNGLDSASIQDINITTLPNLSSLVDNKFVFDISHNQDNGLIQNRCYDFVVDKMLPSLNTTAGVEPSSFVLRYFPFPQPPSIKLKEIFSFPDSCTEEQGGELVDCYSQQGIAEDTFVSEVFIDDCNQYSVRVDYKQQNFGNGMYLLDAKQRIVLKQKKGNIDQACQDAIWSNYSLFKFSDGFLYSLPTEQKKIRLLFYSEKTPEQVQGMHHKVFEASSGWGESTTWSSKPSIGAQIGELSFVGKGVGQGGWWEIDITQIYNLWKKPSGDPNKKQNNGIYIISEQLLPTLDTNDFPRSSVESFSFYSSNAPFALKRPKIVFGFDTQSDIDNAGIIDFNVANRMLVGEDNYALVEVTDWTKSGTSSVRSTERFHVQLKAAEQSNCVLPNNVYGKTGNVALPRIRLDWSWSGNTLDRGIGICDQNNPNYIYCDATQFSMMLLNKIYSIKELAKDPRYREQIAPFLHFNSYLIKDGYSTDFRKDFDYYMRQVSSMDTPAFYNADTSEALWKYFTDNERLTIDSSSFNQGVLASPGLYAVDLTFEWGGLPQWTFFSGGIPTAKIRVTLTRISEPAVPSPLYSIPFDGKIGFNARPTEGIASRQGYGIGYSGKEIHVAYDISNNANQVDTKTIASTIPNSNFVVSEGASFKELNSDAPRGVLLSIDAANKTIKFSPNYATPILMEIDSTDRNVGGYYLIQKQTGPNSTVPVPFEKYGTVWTGMGSSSSDCTDFGGNALFYNAPDRNAFSFAETCEDRNYAQGFAWRNIPESSIGKKIFLQTIFYGPKGETYYLKKACKPNTAFISPADIIPINSSTASQITLNYMQNKVPNEISSFEEVFDLVLNRDGDVCISGNSNKIEFWWNPQAMLRKLESTADTGDIYDKSALIPQDSGWYCPIEATVAP